MSTEKSSNTKDVLAAFQKKHGKTVGNFGGQMVDVGRLPTGVFPFDLATGGGLPRGKCSIIYGPESSGKTNLVYRSIRMHQLLYPNLTCVFISIEGFDPEWASKLGVDVDKLIVVQPSFAEQVVDMAESFLYAEDVGLVAIDSLAAMVTTQESESSADKANVGGATLAIGKLVRKTTLAMEEAGKNGRYPMLIYVNQTRHKIGVMFGDPETMPGGNAPKFQAAMWIRVYGKNKIDPKISTVLPVIKETSFILKKWKVPVTAASGKFEMVMVPHNGFKTGDCDDSNTVMAYLKELGQFAKHPKGGWVILGEHYSTQAKFEERMQKDVIWANEVKNAIIERVKEDGTSIGDEE